jgi:hypothetical protein
MAKKKPRRPAMRAAMPKARATTSPRVEVVRESKPRRKASQAEALDARHTGVVYSSGRDRYSVGPSRILANQDPIIATVGGWKDCGFYEDMLLRHPWLAGIVDQRVEKANRERLIVAGDPSVPRSVDLANIARRKWNKVQGRQTALGRGLRNGRFIGPGGLEKVFTRDSDGIVYVCRLIDRPPRNIKFRNDGTALWQSISHPIDGEEIPRRKMMFIRGGSLNTPYPDVELAGVYPATYLIEKAVELMLDTVEEFGRPVPVVYMPRAKDTLTTAERDKIRSYAAAVHSRFIEIPTNETQARIDLTGNAPLASSGQVGRPEMAIIETMVTWSYIRILRIAQTLNKTGSANGMLERVRYEITDDASRPDCLLLDESLNAVSAVGDEYTGWMADFNDYNFPDEPEEILPRFETPTLSQEEIQQIHDRTMDAIDRKLGSELSKDWYLRATGAEKAKNDDDRLGGEPQTSINRVQEENGKPKTGQPEAEPADEERPTLESIAAQANELTRRLDAMVGA